MANGNGNASYNELVNMLRWIFTEKVEAKFRFTRGLLGDGNGNVDVPDRDGFSYVRPDRSSNKIIELFNKTVDAADETPILIGEIPWQPGIQQVLGIDWESYLKIGWDARFAGLAKHGAEHEWPDTTPGSDTFTVYRRMLFPLRTEAAGGLNVVINPYAMTVTGSNRAWPGSPLFDLTSLVPSTAGNQRFASLFWDYSTNLPHGQIGALTGTLSAISDTSLPVQPTSFPPKSIPSSFVLLQNGDTEITDERVYDAREILSPFNPVTMDDVNGAWKLGNTIVVSSSGNGDYEDIASAIAVATAGDVILVDKGTYTCDNQSLPADVTLRGLSPDDGTILISSSAAITLSVKARGVVKDVEIQNTSSNTTVEALKITGNGAKIYNVFANTDGSATNGYAISITSNNVRLYECDGSGNGSSSDAGIYVYDTARVYVFGGRYTSNNGYDILEGTGTNVIILSGPVLVNGTISGEGFSGLYLDNDGNVIAPTGNVGIGTGTDTPTELLHLQSEASATELFELYADSGAVNLRFDRARGTKASPTAPAGGQNLGQLQFRGYGTGSSSFSRGAQINFEVDGTASDDDVATRIVWYTHEAGDATDAVTERMRLTPTGELKLGTPIETSLGMLRVREDYSDPTSRALATFTQEWSPTGTSGSVFPTAMSLLPKYNSSHTPSSGFLTAFRLFGDIDGGGDFSLRLVDLRGQNLDTGTASTMNIIQIRAGVNSGGGTITAFRAINIENTTAATTNYGIDQAGTAMINRFAGSMTIGTQVNPNATLDVRGDAIFNEGGVAANDVRMESDTKTHMFFLDAGNNVIGINTSSPSASYEVDVSGDHHATNHFDTSDRHFKRNIRTLPNGTLDKVLQLNPVTFQWGWKHAKGMGRSKINSRSAGFIAQDVRKIFPEVVSSWQEGKRGRTYHGLAYNRLVAHLTKAIQELNSKVEDLQAQVDALTP